MDRNRRHIWGGFGASQARRSFDRLLGARCVALHRYYSPAIDEPDQVHLAHRRWISKAEPSLPQRAGRAYQKLLRSLKTGTPQPGTSVQFSIGKRRLQIRGTARPEPDLERIAQVVIAQAFQLVERDAKEKDASNDATT